MPRGKAAVIGDERIAKNGYHYTKVENGEWRLTHWLTAERQLGRELLESEMVQFVDPKFKRDPKNPKGIRIIKKRTSSIRRRLAVIETRIEELQAEKKDLQAQLNRGAS